MEIVNRKSIYESLKKFSPIFKEEDFIEITEWTNGEGWDITIGSTNETKILSLHRDELEAINYLTKALEFEFLVKEIESFGSYGKRCHNK